MSYRKFVYPPAPESDFMRLPFSRFIRVPVGLAILVACSSVPAFGQAESSVDEVVEPKEDVSDEGITPEQEERQAELVSDIRQLTFAGKRAGEGYFSADGKQMVFQSEREAGNPFFQIYLMDLENGDTRRISPGIGKTTCAWISPSGEEVIYASTQFDPKAIEKQKSEIELRESGKERRYSWDYDETYDLVTFNTKTHQYEQLTTEIGYDAEGSYSPDGKLVCFASNRRAYSGDLSEEEKKLFEFDPASAMDIYIMNRDGSGVRRLTEAPGYDGGPFFSPDGTQICWRRFSTNGAQAEIMLMNIDGSNQRAITSLESMSWAPYFHPSGDYLIFATNLHGFNNFELYMIDAQAQHDPVRVTHRDGFDGLPVFKPDGETLVWTSNSGADESQLYEAAWNDTKARELLGLTDGDAASDAAGIAANVAAQNDAGFKAADVGRHIDYLCRPELGGRMTGSAGEKQATAYVAAYLESLGLKPAGEDGTFFHSFEFVSSVTLGPNNSLSFDDETYKLDRRWRPVFFSKEGTVEPTAVVCAGYGIVAPAEQGQEEYDSYVHLDVKDKWVLVFREMPQDIPAERRQQIARYSGARYKSMVARDRGAAGIIFVSGPTSPIRNRLMPLQMDGSLGATSISVISVDDSVAEAWMQRAGKSLRGVQTSLDDGSVQMGFELEGVKVAAEIDVEPVTSHGRNVVARLAVADTPTQESVLVGAHIDHLGNGEGGGSLAKDEERGGMHRGADDNASGVAGMLEMAQYLADQIQGGRLEARRDILFAAWSGEELGLRGSQAFAEDFEGLYPVATAHGHAAAAHAAAHAHAAVDVAAAHGAEAEAAHSAVSHGKQVLYPRLAAALNLDMIGRLRGDLVLQGIGSSDYWEQAIERRNAVVRLGLTLQDDCYLPTDASTFFLAGVPILSAFTGSHPEYHTPRDVPELINFEGAAKTARLMALITRDLVTSESAPNYQEQEAEQQVRATLRAFLGTVPDYADESVKGVLLNSVKKGGPADKGGIRGGDVIVELAGKKIENIYDYTYAIEALKVGQVVKIKVKRGGKDVTLDVTPESRQ